MSASSGGWLFGRTTDLLLGCGLAYIAVAALHTQLGPSLSQALPGGLLILCFAVPHYGATLLRVYEQAEDRSKYRFFGLHVTIGLLIAFAACLQVGLLGSLALTLYLTWSPWHYTGQNYGIALMLLGRRGVPVTPGVKWLIWGSFVASFLLTFLATHGAERSSNYAPVSYSGTSYYLMPLGIPPDWASVAMVVTAVVYIALLVLAVGAMARAAGGVRALGPVLVILATQALWFSVPVLLRLASWFAPAAGAASPFSAYGFLWIAAAHSVQYLWITTYFATHSSSEQGRLRFLVKAALCGFAIWTVPGLLFAPGLLGGVTYDSGLALLVTAFVNLHHFVLDGAVWKLRDGRVGRILLRSDSVENAPIGPGGRSWVRPAVWAAGLLSIAVSAVGFWESEFGYRRALDRGDLVRAEAALERFALLGRDGPTKRTLVARRFASEQNYEKASRHLERAIEIAPTYRALHTLGLVRAEQARWSEALEAYDAALALAPESPDTLYHRGLAQLEAGDLAAAIGDFERLLEIDPSHDPARLALARARIARERTAEGS